ncbi:hypothetical protein OBBRIDRAFT_838937 [Obba rivulosa]|uniref:Uncharacterized protein n=1 Tax=Obba rivulosa TaxID=1052685 RepID=A0A8E2ANH3_9APHY|nr:hypothetical protein OBBRIDRAFT_838937 [Obba rivulosa]
MEATSSPQPPHPTPVPLPVPPPKSPDSSAIRAGIIGGVVGASVLGVIVVMLYLLYRRRSCGKSESTASATQDVECTMTSSGTSQSSWRGCPGQSSTFLRIDSLPRDAQGPLHPEGTNVDSVHGIDLSDELDLPGRPSPGHDIVSSANPSSLGTPESPKSSACVCQESNSALPTPTRDQARPHGEPKLRVVSSGLRHAPRAHPSPSVIPGSAEPAPLASSVHTSSTTHEQDTDSRYRVHGSWGRPGHEQDERPPDVPPSYEASVSAASSTPVISNPSSEFGAPRIYDDERRDLEVPNSLVDTLHSSGVAEPYIIRNCDNSVDLSSR